MKDNVTFREKIGYGFGDRASSMFWKIFGMYLLFFYTRVFGITPAAAGIAAVLNIKPVLTIQGEKLDAFAKVRGKKAAKKTMLDALEKDITERFAGEEVYIRAAYTCSEEEAAEWLDEIRARFPEYTVYGDRLSLSVSCHIGPGALAVLCCRVLPETGRLPYPPEC